MSFSFFDHTGDIGVRVTARTLDELFRDAAAAFTETVTDAGRVETRRSVSLTLEAAAADLLLVDWLNEILYRFEVDRYLVGAVDVRVDRRTPGRERSDALAAEDAVAAFALHGTLHGEPFDAERHGVKVLIKAITYHALEVREGPDGWQATVVFDI
jgi:SHS2 domain-containing protein